MTLLSIGMPQVLKGCLLTRVPYIQVAVSQGEGFPGVVLYAHFVLSSITSEWSGMLAMDNPTLRHTRSIHWQLVPLHIFKLVSAELLSVLCTTCQSSVRPRPNERLGAACGFRRTHVEPQVIVLDMCQV
jgi:hypothetical protein